jgi:acyl-coenzyme A thioesterase PaaI-like protein
MSNIPDGFKPITSSHPFGAMVGPLYHKQIGDGPDDWVRGFLVEKKHCNRIGFCHAGMLSFFGDVILGQSFWNHGHGPCVTMSIDNKHIWPVKLGDWIQGNSKIIKLEGDVENHKGIVHIEAHSFVGHHKVMINHGVHRQINRRSGAWEDFPK